RQSAYRILVAHDPGDLVPGRADVWDSGRVESDRSVGVAYDGPALRPRTRYHWRVQIWDEHGRASGWSRPAWFETGMLGEDWSAAWIGAAPPDDDPLNLEGTSWIWTSDASTSNAPAGTRWFRARLELPAAEVERARVV